MRIQLRSEWRQQHGIATILILLLTGLFLMAVVLGANFYIRSTQEVQMTHHAVTQAQMKAWNGVEVVTYYFENLKVAELKTLIDAKPNREKNTVIALNFDGVEAARIVDIKPDPKNPAAYLFSVDVYGATAAGTRAESHSTVETVLSVVPGNDGKHGSGTIDPPPRAVLVFKKGLSISGDVKLFEGDIKHLEIIVDGDVNTSGSMVGVEIIKSTGNVNISSTGSYELIHANGTVTVNNSAKIKNLWSARASWPNSIEVDMKNGAAQADLIRANGNVSLSSTALMGEIYAGGQLKWTNREAKVGKGMVGSLAVNKPAGVNVNVDPAYQSKVPMVTLIEDEKFDAYAYKHLANYVFEVDPKNFKKVTVRRISGIADGTYFLGRYGGNQHRDYLCSTLTAASTPTEPSCERPAFGQAKTICNRGQWNGECFTYDAAKKTWGIALTNGNGSQGIVQGVMWFEGSLHVGNGKYQNTFIATHNITTSANTETYAPNFSGYEAGSYVGNGNVRYTFLGMCVNSHFPTLYPKQFCETATGSRVSKDQFQSEVDGGLGNFAFLAGSQNGANYLGGDIRLEASNQVFGSVWAGNLYGNSGSTNIYGYITAQAQGNVGSTNNMGASTTINLKNLPTTYKPGGSLGFDKKKLPVEAVPPVPNTAKVKWTRYL